jgi:phosphomannomutase
MNRALVRRVTAGLAAYLLEHLPQARERGVVVGYDGRHLSTEFAADTSGVLAGAGIRVHAFTDVAPTPVIAFAVTELGAAAGVMVTASHNPPEYNGYKVYWENGAQIIPPHDSGISAAIDAVGDLASVRLLDGPEAESQGLLRLVPESLGATYVDRVLRLRRSDAGAGSVSVVYSPMHGVGGAWVKRVFAAAGYTGLHVVPEQAEPDGDFPTVRFPNPEEPGAMDLSLALARERDADLILANDPDADRLAVITRAPDGGYRPLSGNEIGILLANYLLEKDAPENPLVCTTIVSTGMLRLMAEAYGAAYAETLTGFKWIANKALELKRSRGMNFVFGFEEALGYTAGELVRDKDGVSAALLFADLFGACRAGGLTIVDYLEQIYRRFGLHQTRQISLTMEGSEGLARIEAMMSSLRRDPVREVNGVAVVVTADVKEGTERNLQTGAITRLDLPPSNVLRYNLADGTRLLARPSGTEPKIKFYVEVVEAFGEEDAFAEASARAGERCDGYAKAFAALAKSRAG